MNTGGARSCTLQIEALSKSYGDTRAVDRVSLTVSPGEVLTLLGPSGCGKTTLLQSIAGFVVPDAGDIRLDGASILATPPEKRRTAMLFQQYALFPHLSVRDNVGFGLRMARVARPEAARRVDDALRLVRIHELAARLPGQLSGGQRQRVALARALVTEPRLLLLDEPLGALDQNLREEMQVELRKLQRKLGVTTVMVTHDQREAIVLSDRIAVMNDGRIEQIGSPTDIYDHPRTRYIATFTGVENLLPAQLTADGVVTLAGQAVPGVATNGAAPGAVTLAVRSEAITVHPPEQGGSVRSPEQGGSANPPGQGGPARPPHPLGTDHPAAPGAIAGTIGYVQILGPSLRYEVAVAPDLMLAVTEVRRDAAPFEPGQPVTIRLAASRCTVLTA